MFLERIKSSGLAHLSYIIGDGNEAAVVDPRRDIDVYIKKARQHGCVVKHIFETHRNEDYVIGSFDLARQTGANIHHGKGLDFAYGEPVESGDMFKLNQLLLTVLETPGHTFESISIAVSDQDFGQDCVAVFTGDALFVGDVGRTDFFPGQAREVASLLYDSIQHQILPLGDQAILLPAHGAGSVCGSGMASREFSTLGYERRNSPMLQMTRNEFIEHKLNERHHKPPYFARMEQYNQFGAPELTALLQPQPLAPVAFINEMGNGMVAIDTRSPEAVAGVFVPHSLAIPLGMLPAFAGWFLPYDKPLGLIMESRDNLETAVRYLLRLGYDNIVGYLEGGVHDWETHGFTYDTIPAVHASRLLDRKAEDENLVLLDVRSEREFERSHIPGAMNIYVGNLPERIEEVPRGRPIITFCGSGRRAIIAASILKNAGFTQVEDCLGSMAACKALGCELVGKPMPLNA